MTAKKTAKRRGAKKTSSKGKGPAKEATAKAAGGAKSRKAKPKRAAAKRSTTKKKAAPKKTSVKKTSKAKASSATAPKAQASIPDEAREDRYQRPSVDRAHPQRSWQSGHPGFTSHIGPFGTRDPWEADEPTRESGRRMGYDVINRHIQEGWDASDEPGYGSGNPFSWLADQATRAHGPGVAAGQRWLEMLDSFGGLLRAIGVPKGLGFAQAGASADDLWNALGLGARTGPQASATSPVLRIASRRPVEVEVDLKRGSRSPMKAHLSHAEDSQLGRVLVAMSDVSEEGRVYVSLEVGDEMPSGVYSGAFLSGAHHEVVGTMTVRVFD